MAGNHKLRQDCVCCYFYTVLCAPTGLGGRVALVAEGLVAKGELDNNFRKHKIKNVERKEVQLSVMPP